MGVDHINLKATSTDPLANIIGTGEYALDFGANVFDISVTDPKWRYREANCHDSSRL
ncbi:hypothetical protein MGH68_17430 [Erysipelothrix sp. D19-032]